MPLFRSLLLTLILGTTHLSAEDASSVAPNFELIDPEMAPPEIRPQVLRGYQLMMRTHKLLPEYAGDAVSCSNCHFAAGNTLGGKNGGISLVGVSQKYPVHLPDNKLYTLAERINSCFERSLNGKPLPIESEHMKNLLAYLDWISSPVAKLPDPTATPWLGLNRKMRVEHTMDPINGKRLYAIHCALCHGAEGQGQQRNAGLSYPPLWGPKSFNDGAGMDQLPILASFIHQNMPYDDPGLSLEEALDIAFFITTQPRPHFDDKRIP